MKNTQDKFAAQIAAWLDDRLSPWAKGKRMAKGFYHNKVPQNFRFYGVLHWLAKTGMASSAPAVAYGYGSISGLVAVVAGSAIFLGNGAVAVLDRMSKDKSIGASDNETDIIIRFGDLLTAHRVDTAATDRDDAIRACLGILEVFSRQITKSKPGDVAVSLVQYVGNSKTRMRIKHRNPGNQRPLNREFDAEKLLGHHACQNGALPQVVHDVGEFGRGRVSSPTQSKLDYRSIFFYPIFVGDEDKTVKGFVSIDCKRPYAFYGNRSSAIIVTCEPILNHLGELIQEVSDVRGRKGKSASRGATDVKARAPA